MQCDGVDGVVRIEDGEVKKESGLVRRLRMGLLEVEFRGRNG
jgi:hypothetical protein